jgi:orc1/cdc6 family replication initiation protein
MSVIEDSAPLQQQYLPDEFIDREREQELLSNNFGGQNLHIHGPRGTGKTHVVRKKLADLDQRICYVDCLKHDTQYKALQSIIEQLSDSPVKTGYHTSELQRKIEKQVEVFDLVIVLDEVDFLLLNDGDDLLYFLSRLSSGPQIVCITANTEDLQEQVEPRTFSSLHPRRIQFEPYTGKQIYEILSQRASKSLRGRSVHRNAVTYIASTVQNTGKALTWLRTAAQNTDDVVTEELVEQIGNDAHDRYVEEQLEKLSQHHKLLYQAVQELTEEKGPVVNAGDIYKRYQTVATERQIQALSDRRISDYLKHLEQLNLIAAEYHYGGKKGKTRDVQLRSFGS